MDGHSITSSKRVAETRTEHVRGEPPNDAGNERKS
jgi:hypothetical protein